MSEGKVFEVSNLNNFSSSRVELNLVVLKRLVNLQVFLNIYIVYFNLISFLHMKGSTDISAGNL